MASKDGKQAQRIERLISSGYSGTSYYFARKVNCTPSYAWKVLEGMVREGKARKTIINDKYIYSAKGGK